MQHRGLQVEVLRAFLGDGRGDEAELGVLGAQVAQVAGAEVVPRQLARGERGVEARDGVDLLEALLRDRRGVADVLALLPERGEVAPR